MCKWKIGNYVNKDGRNIAWMIPADCDPNDTAGRNKGITPGNALKILNSLPQTAEVLAVKAVAEGCQSASKGVAPSSSAVPPPLPGEVKFYVAYPDKDGRMGKHESLMTAPEVALFMVMHENILVCQVGGKSWVRPSEFGILPLPVTPVVSQDEPPPIIGEEPPAIPGSKSIDSGKDLMKRVMDQRKAG